MDSGGYGSQSYDSPASRRSSSPSSSYPTSANLQLETTPLPREILQLRRHYNDNSDGHDLLPENSLDNMVQQFSSSCVNGAHVELTHHLSVSAMAVTVTTSGIEAKDVWKCGYLRKLKPSNQRFFVLRGPSNTGPSRLEYYDSEKKFRNKMTSSKPTSAVSSPKKIIYLHQCLTISKRADSKHRHLIALYTKDEYFVMIAESEKEQEDWCLALSELMIEEKKERQDAEDMDDGYWTLAPGSIFKEVWQVIVKPKGLGQTKNLAGVCRLCLSAKTIRLVKASLDTPSVNLPLVNIRRCGHSESFFFIEVGRSSSTGPGEIWMQVDSGDPALAQNIHETILEAMRALRAIPDFRQRSASQSCPSNPCAAVHTRRHPHGNLPPSQTGLRCSSKAGSVVRKHSSKKSEGDEGLGAKKTSSQVEGTINQRTSPSNGTLPFCDFCINKSFEESLSHCACISTCSPVNGSSSSGRGIDKHPRHHDTSVCSSASDRRPIISDVLGSERCIFQVSNSNTTATLCNTTHLEDNSQGESIAVEKSTTEHSGEYHRNTLCTPKREKYLSSKPSSLRRWSEFAAKDGYMPMTPGLVPHGADGTLSEVSLPPTPPKTPGATSLPLDLARPYGCMMMLPHSCSKVKDSLGEVDPSSPDEYVTMFLRSTMEEDADGSPEALKLCRSSCTSPRTRQAPLQKNERDDYVPMCHPVGQSVEGTRRRLFRSSPCQTSHPSSDVQLDISDLHAFNVNGLSLERHGLILEGDQLTTTELILNSNRLDNVALGGHCVTCDAHLPTGDATSPNGRSTSLQESCPESYAVTEHCDSAGQNATTRRWLHLCLPFCLNTDDSE